ncbi:hypothetical protein, partial [Klebsiella pneumoniae]|uniref:hypothetical protein n=1 Tax=Klebsiella pneumoniae TaxID=573 RepID=UPI001D183A58
MPGIRARYSGWGLVEAQATRCQLLLQERPEAKTVQKLKPGHHPDPFRDKAKTSDNLCPQMRFIIHGGHCCKVSDEAAFCLIQRPYISKTLLT